MEKTAREEIIELVNKLFIFTDYQRWEDLLKDVLTEEVHFDMSSLGGGEPTFMKATAIRDAWKEGFAGIDHIHHQSGNYLVTFVNPDQADVFCYAVASHYKQSALQGSTRSFVGSYNIGVTMTTSGWRINRFKYNLKYMDGNIELK
ncbi:MAG TPA: nuclear transport factor 2 family protein [Cyclobacteriaceae bacterium]|nr:nuclear transport factor 2 family protein [Cyclobacteriaceae bacterium]